MYKDAGGAGDIFLRNRQACQKLRKVIISPAGLVFTLHCCVKAPKGAGSIFPSP